MKAITGIALTALLMGTLMLAFNIQQTESPEPPATEWTRIYRGADTEWAVSVVETSDGGYAIAGPTTSFGAGGMDFWLVKVDSFGNMEWNQTYGGTKTDLTSSVVETSDGGYALAGYTTSFGAGGMDSWLVKADSAGNQEWNRAHGGTNDDWAESVVETSDGGYALGGHTTSFGAGGRDFWLVKVDSFGNMEWNQTYGGTDTERAFSVVETSDGGYALAGYTESFGAGFVNSWLVKVDSFGNMEWNQTYGGIDYFYESHSMAQTKDGGYAIAGHTWSIGTGDSDFWLVKVDSFGNMEWNQTYGGTDTERAFSVVETSDGGYAIAGDRSPFGVGGGDFWLVKVAGRPTHGDKLGLLALGIGLAAATLVVAVATTIYAFIKRARTLKNSTISL